MAFQHVCPVPIYLSLESIHQSANEVNGAEESDSKSAARGRKICIYVYEIRD